MMYKKKVLKRLKIHKKKSRYKRKIKWRKRGGKKLTRVSGYVPGEGKSEVRKSVGKKIKSRKQYIGER